MTTILPVSQEDSTQDFNGKELYAKSALASDS